MINSIRDALMSTSNGQKMVVQVMDARRDIPRRIRSLKELVHSTFVDYPRQHGRRVRFDVYEASKETVRQLGVNGGADYDKAVIALQYASRSRKDFEDAIDVLLPHNFNDYESSDTLDRHAA